MTAPIRIRFSLVGAVLFLVLGGLNVAIGALRPSSALLVLGALLALLGVLQLVGTAVVVAPDEVQVRNPLQMTVRRVAIRGLTDLRVEDSRLHHAVDGRKITGLGSFSARPSDVERLRRAILQELGAR